MAHKPNENTTKFQISCIINLVSTEFIFCYTPSRISTPLKLVSSGEAFAHTHASTPSPDIFFGSFGTNANEPM